MKKYLISLLILTLSYPSGYIAGAVIDESDLILRAVYKLIQKVSSLEERVRELERKVEFLPKKIQEYNKEGVKSKYIVVAKKLRIRSCPSFSCKVLGHFRKGDVVEELRTFGDWKKVRGVYGGKEGWVYEKYLLPY